MFVLIRQITKAFFAPGEDVGSAVGLRVGTMVGFAVGAMVGQADGATDGTAVGNLFDRKSGSGSQLDYRDKEIMV